MVFASHAPSHDGVCGPNGFALRGTGPNCTFVGRRAWKWPEVGVGSEPGLGVMLGGCARNVRSALETHTRAWVEAALQQTGGGMLIFEDLQRAGDMDGSRAALREWATKDLRVRLILSQPLVIPRATRTRACCAPQSGPCATKGTHVSLIAALPEVEPHTASRDLPQHARPRGGSPPPFERRSGLHRSRLPPDDA